MYDRLGDLQWIRQFGTAGTERSLDIALDGLGSVYVTGYTDGELGDQSAGGFDAYLSKYNGDGDRLWIRQFGTDTTDTAASVSTDGSGNVFVAGGTRGDLAGTTYGNFADPAAVRASQTAFVIKLSDVVVPEPTSLALVLIIVAFGMSSRRRGFRRQ